MKLVRLFGGPLRDEVRSVPQNSLIYEFPVGRVTRGVVQYRRQKYWIDHDEYNTRYIVAAWVIDNTEPEMWSWEVAEAFEQRLEGIWCRRHHYDGRFHKQKLSPWIRCWTNHTNTPMNDIVREFQDVLRHNEFDDDELYEAFLAGWQHRDEWNIPAPPHRIFQDNIPDRVIEEYYELGWKRGIDYAH